MTSKKLAPTGTRHELPFERLSGRDFERLCLALIARLGYDRLEHLGAAGSEQGRDIIAYKDDKLIAFQSKKVQRFGPEDARAEARKIISLPKDEQPSEYIYLVTRDVSVTTRQAAQEVLGSGIKATFWGLTELDALVSQHTDVKGQFFGTAAGEGDTVILNFYGLTGQAFATKNQERAAAGLKTLFQFKQHFENIAALKSKFQLIYGQITNLRKYKSIHEDFKKLEELSGFLEQSLEKMPEQKGWNLLIEHEPSVYNKIKDLFDTTSEYSFSIDETVWKADLEVVQDNLRQTVDAYLNTDEQLSDFDCTPIENALRKLQRVLNLYPTRINKSLVDTAKMIQLEVLVETIREMLAPLQAANADQGDIQKIQECIAGLTELDLQLKELIGVHGLMQIIDDGLRAIDTLEKLSVQKGHWLDMDSETQALLSHTHVDWMLELDLSFQDLDAAFTEDEIKPRKIQVLFPRYRRHVSNRFHQVDLDLLHVSGQLVEIAKLLEGLMEGLS